MSRQNRDTWQIWARIPVIIISILGNIVLSLVLYLVLRNFVGPTFRFFVLLAIKTRVLRVKKITTRQTQKAEIRGSVENFHVWMTYITLPAVNIGLCLHVLRNIKRLLLRRSPDLSFSPDFFLAQLKGVMMLGIMRRIWAPEWKYITEPSRPHPPNFISNSHWTRSSKTTDLDLKKKKKT